MEIAEIRREKLRQYIKQNYKTRAEFADAIGKSPAQVAMWFMKSDGKRDIGEKLAREIEAALGLPNCWMDGLENTSGKSVQKTGFHHRSPSIDKNEREKRLSEYKESIKDLPEEVQQQKLTDYFIDSNSVYFPARRKAPVISYVQAGNWGGLVDPYPVGTGGEEIEIDTKWSANTFVLKVRGDSMAPTLMEGAYIVVDPNVEWMHNRIVVVRQNGDTEVTVKRLVKDGDTYYLKPDNTNYRPMEMGKDAHICGVVVELVMKFL